MQRKERNMISSPLDEGEPTVCRPKPLIPKNAAKRLIIMLHELRHIWMKGVRNALKYENSLKHEL